MQTKEPGRSNARDSRVQLGPERSGDLEVVALMAHHVEEGFVAAELEIFTRRIGAQRLVRLAVGVAPEMNERQLLRCDAQRIGAAQFAAMVVEYADGEVGFFIDYQAVDERGEFSGLALNRFRQSPHLHGALKAQLRRDAV